MAKEELLPDSAGVSNLNNSEPSSATPATDTQPSSQRRGVLRPDDFADDDGHKLADRDRPEKPDLWTGRPRSPF